MKVCSAFLIALVAASPAAAKPPLETWGRTGVSFDQYRADAIECAKIGYFRDVADDEPAKRFIAGWRQADNSLNGGGGGSDWVQSVLRTQPDRRRRELHAIHVGDVEACLAGKGYSKFTLTQAEQRQLNRYRAGSDDRHRYLHSLAAADRPT